MTCANGGNQPLYAMEHMKKPPILVTGSHRSGSTWVGKMLALSPSVAYVHEPFNPCHPRHICRAEFPLWFQYICDENQSKFAGAVEDCLHFRRYWSKELPTANSTGDVIRLLRSSARAAEVRFLRKRPLVKDPIAVFSAEWLARRFNVETVVLIRHPAAFAGSLKAAGWSHPFSHFLEQPLLMQHHLTSFRRAIEEFAKRDRDVVDQAILLWNLVHYMILGYRRNHPEWLYVRHEDISRAPVEEFRRLYAKLGLSFSVRIRKAIAGFCTHDSPEGNTDPLKRDSRANILGWKERLTSEEIKRVRDGTREIADEFYGDEDWGT